MTACLDPGPAVGSASTELTTDPSGSCLASDGTATCGGWNGTCGCDDGCHARGDCCDDEIAVCGSTCGDGVAYGSEQCDSADLAGRDCADLGFLGGTLGCSTTCSFDSSACVTGPTCTAEHAGGVPSLVKHGAVNMVKPIEVAAGDFDGDGDADLVAFDTVGTNQYRIKTYANDGAAGFALVAERDEVYYPYEIATGDIDGDGKLDLAFTGGSGPIVRLITMRGNGDGSFGVRTNQPAFELTYELALVDLDGDGDLDVALSDNSHLTVRLNNGTGQFGAQAPYLLGKTGAYRMEVADFDGDGAIDLIASHERSPGGMTLLRGNGNGTFDGSGQTYTNLEKQVGEVVAPDLDHDGHRDIVYTAWNYPKVIGVRRGVGGGALDPNTFEYTPGGDKPRYLQTADMNCDGDADIISSSRNGYTSGAVTIFVGDGSGLLEDGVYKYMYGLRDIDVADLDGDQVADIAAVRESPGWFGDPAAHEVTIYLTQLAE